MRFQATLPPISHPITLGDLTDAEPLIADTDIRDLVLIADANTARYARRLPFGGNLIHVPCGEEAKSWRVAMEVFSSLRPSAVSRRSSMLIGLGGGAICDLTGFVAMLFMRGVPYALLPTSLLAMIDAAIGSKVAINDPSGTKNLLGGFYAPEFVHIDLGVLETLEPRQLRAGFAEAIKVALISEDGGRLLSFFEERVDELLARDPKALSWVTGRCVEIKKRLVEPDLLERNLDRALNLGHALGHALEAASGNLLLHGEAVAIGLAQASRLGVRRGLCEEPLAERVEALLRAFSLPTRVPRNLSRSRLIEELEAMARVRDGDMREVIPTRPGEATIVHDVRPDELLEGMRS